MNFNFNAKLKKIEDVQTDFLNLNYPDEWKNLNFGSDFAQGSFGKSVKKEHFDQLALPCRSLVDLGGKRWRPLFLVLCAELCESTEQALEFSYKMTPLVEMVHTASLIHDDIEDGADTRRGKPASHITYGLDTSINAASWLYFSSFSVIDKNISDEKLKNQFYALLSEHLRRLHLGQAMDIFWHRNPRIIPSRQEYSAMVRMKTGTLASLAGQAGILCGNSFNGKNSTDACIVSCKKIGEIASNIGEGFQILDDIINITTGNKGKKRGDDIVEGKKSLPLILHLEENPSDKESLLECFENAAKDGIESPSVEKAISILGNGDCIHRAKEYAANLITSSCDEIKKMWSNNEASLQIESLFTSMLD